MHVRSDIYNYIDRLFAGSYKSREEFTLTYDIEKEISPDSPVHHRTKAIKELRDAVLNQQWEDVYIYILIYIYLKKTTECQSKCISIKDQTKIMLYV